MVLQLQMLLYEINKKALEKRERCNNTNTMESDSLTHGKKWLETLTTTSAAHKLGAVSKWHYGCELGFI